jgi:hypothetical protein
MDGSAEVAPFFFGGGEEEEKEERKTTQRRGGAEEARRIEGFLAPRTALRMTGVRLAEWLGDWDFAL